MSLLRSGVDLYSLYTIIKRISMPFKDWDAYKQGVIDDKGNFLIAKKDRTSKQHSSLTYLDIFALNLKKLLGKVPGGNNKYVTYAAALWLLREDRYLKMDMLNEEGEAMVADSATPANASSGELARSSEMEAKAFRNKVIRRKLKPTT